MIPIKLYKGERIIAVVPELGRKGAQDVVWVYVEGLDLRVRYEGIIAEEMPSCMYIMHAAAAEMHRAFVAMVKTERVNDIRPS